MYGSFFQSLGWLSVAVFFFLSGYGLIISAQRKGASYIQSFPIKRIVPFYINNVILILVYVVISVFVIGNPFSLNSFIRSFLWGGTVIANGWYLQAILVFYIAFYCIFRLIKELKHQIVAFGLFTLCYCASCVLLHISTTWYVTVFAMPFGMLWCYYSDGIVAHFKKHYFSSLIVALIAFAIPYVGYAICSGESIRNLLLIWFSVSFTALVATVIYKLPINFKVTRIFGQYSFEIYVVQGIAMNILHSRVVNIENDWIYCALCFVMIALLSIAVHPIFTLVNKKFKDVQYAKQN